MIGIMLSAINPAGTNHWAAACVRRGLRRLLPDAVRAVVVAAITVRV